MNRGSRPSTPLAKHLGPVLRFLSQHQPEEAVVEEKHVLLQVGDRTIGPITVTLGSFNEAVTLEDYRDAAIACAIEDGDLSPDELPLVMAAVCEANEIKQPQGAS
jgi:hypothetical protein